ncbi:hypothetical protein ACIK7D_25950 [Agrobacterium sp. P15N1-A]
MRLTAVSILLAHDAQSMPSTLNLVFTASFMSIVLVVEATLRPLAARGARKKSGEFQIAPQFSARETAAAKLEVTRKLE